MHGPDLGAGVEGFLEASIGDTRYAEKEVTGEYYDTTFLRTNSVRSGVTAETSADGAQPQRLS